MARQGFRSLACLLAFSVVLLFSVADTAKTPTADEGTPVTLTLEHALSSNTFTPRGSISFRLANNLLSLSNPAHIASGLKITQVEPSLSDERSLAVCAHSVSPAFLTIPQNLANNQQYYRIRIKLPPSKEQRKSPYLVASVPAVINQFASHNLD